MSRQPPTQELVAKDLHANEWRFRHIFRGIGICMSRIMKTFLYFLFLESWVIKLMWVLASVIMTRSTTEAFASEWMECVC